MGQIERFIRAQGGGAAGIMTPGAASAILRSIGRTPSQIAEAYHTHISSLNDRGLLHTIGLREPCLLETPLIALDETHFLCPAPNLVSLAFLRGMSRLGGDISPEVFGEEIGSTLEAYIGALVSENTSFVVVPKRLLKNIVTKKTCDFACISSSCIILIECKAIAKAARSIDPPSVRQSPFAGQVSRAIVQLANVASDIKGGRLKDLGCDPDVPIFAFVVTIAFDPMADSPWYWSTVWEPETTGELGPVQEWSKLLLGYRPHVLSVADFEYVVWYLSMYKGDMAEVFHDYSAQDYPQTGSMARYAHSKLRDLAGPRRQLQPAHRAYGQGMRIIAPAVLNETDNEEPD